MANETPKSTPLALQRLDQVYLAPHNAVIERNLIALRFEAERQHQIIELFSIYGTDPALITALRDRSLRRILTFFGEYQPARKKHTFIPIYGLSVFSLEKQYQIIPDENKLEFQHLVISEEGILIIKKPSPTESDNSTQIESVTSVTDANGAWYFDEGNILGPSVKPEFVEEKLGLAVFKFADGIENHTWINEV